MERKRFRPEIPLISEELYDKTREAVELAGYDFTASIRRVSVRILLGEDKQREREGKPWRLGFVCNSKNMLGFKPPQMEVAINPKNFKIDGSNRLSTVLQEDEIKKEQEKLRDQLPEDIRHLVNLKMVDPSTLSQLEDAYMDERRELLFPDFIARTNIMTIRGEVAAVGRVDSLKPRRVISVRRGLPYDSVYAVSVVILPQKLSA